MSAGSAGSGEGRPNYRSEPEPPVGQPRIPLEEILNWSVLDPAQEARGPAWEPFLAVARRYPGAPCALDPIAVELVHAALQERFSAQPRAAALWRDLAETIAQTLWEDPAARGRLELLWAHLAERIS